jgi:hypothetical protein
MVTSYGENSGFTLATADELVLVNGGKGGSSSASNAGTVDPIYGVNGNGQPYVGARINIK